MTKTKKKSRRLLCNKTFEIMTAVVVTFFVATLIEKKAMVTSLLLLPCL
jgi:hypothetical protein